MSHWPHFSLVEKHPVIPIICKIFVSHNRNKGIPFNPPILWWQIPFRLYDTTDYMHVYVRFLKLINSWTQLVKQNLQHHSPSMFFKFTLIPYSFNNNKTHTRRHYSWDIVLEFPWKVLLITGWFHGVQSQKLHCDRFSLTQLHSGHSESSSLASSLALPLLHLLMPVTAGNLQGQPTKVTTFPFSTILHANLTRSNGP